MYFSTLFFILCISVLVTSELNRRELAGVVFICLFEIISFDFKIGKEKF
jgi:hypothetical protein